MRAGAEGKARIEFEHDGRCLSRPLSGRADPQALPETHRAEVLEPFALPGAIGEMLDADRGGLQPEHGFERRSEQGRLRGLGEERAQANLMPERRRTGRGLEQGLVARVCQRECDRAEPGAGVLGAREVIAAELDHELVPAHFSPRRRSR